MGWAPCLAVAIYRPLMQRSAQYPAGCRRVAIQTRRTKPLLRRLAVRPDVSAKFKCFRQAGS
jgi:hypothetical protein